VDTNSLHTKLKNALRIDRAIKFVWEASPLYIVLSGILVIILGVLPLLSLYMIKLIIDSVSSLVFSHSGTPGQGELFQPAVYILVACAIGLVTTFFNFLSEYIKKAQSLTVTDHMYSVIHQKSSQIDLSYYESPDYKDMLYRAQTDGPTRPISIVHGLFDVGESGASFIAVTWLLLLFNPVLPVILIVAALPGILLRLKFSSKIYSWQQKRTDDERKTHYFHWMLTDDIHAKEFRLFNLGKHFIEQFKSLRIALKSERLWFEKRKAFGNFIAQASAVLVVFGSFVYLASTAIKGHITLGDMVMYFQAIQRGVTMFRALLENGAQMYEDNLFLSHLYDFLKLDPKVPDPIHPKPVPCKISKGFEFKDVNFFYQEYEKNLINCVNFSIQPGEVVALVGENGAGKSTIVKLLTRLYDPVKGEITLDGENINQFNIKAYRKKISVVFQDYIKYYLSAKENIYLGNIENKEDDSGIRRAAVLSGADDKISTLESGYNTILGRQFHDGNELSIGQWQMIALARAFFRDADLVILDEPSSALDPENEMRIFSKVKELIRDRSALIISHRYSTVKMADKILVLDKGEIIEQGSHQELMQKKGKYATLFTLQAKNYA